MVPDAAGNGNDPLLLYGLPLSSFAAKVRLALALKGLAAEWRAPPGGYGSAAYRAIVPAGTIPALVHGDLVLPESDAILEYLEDAFPEAPPLRPAGARDRARMRYLGRLHDLHLEPPVRALFPKPAPADAAQPIARIAEKLALVEQALDAEGPFAAGPLPTLADCAFPATLACAAAILPRYGACLAPGPRLARCRAAWAMEPRMGPVIAAYGEALAPWVAQRFEG